MQKRKTCSREFKQEAVRRLERGDRPAADIARELGINRNQLYKWQEQQIIKGPDTIPCGTGKQIAGQCKESLEPGR